MQFVKAGSTVIITGRREEALKKTVAEISGLKYIVNDIEGRSLLPVLCTIVRAHDSIAHNRVHMLDVAEPELVLQTPNLGWS